MAYFAQLDENNVVLQIQIVDDRSMTDTYGMVVENIGVAQLEKKFGGLTHWKQTTTDDHFRGNYAGIGYTFMTNVATLGVASTDVFMTQQPFPSWVVGINTAAWYSPLGERPKLTDEEWIAGKYYEWDEDAYQADTSNPKTVGWVLRTVDDASERS